MANLTVLDLANEVSLAVGHNNLAGRMLEWVNHVIKEISSTAPFSRNTGFWAAYGQGMEPGFVWNKTNTGGTVVRDIYSNAQVVVPRAENQQYHAGMDPEMIAPLHAEAMHQIHITDVATTSAASPAYVAQYGHRTYGDAGHSDMIHNVERSGITDLIGAYNGGNWKTLVGLPKRYAPLPNRYDTSGNAKQHIMVMNMVATTQHSTSGTGTEGYLNNAVVMRGVGLPASADDHEYTNWMLALYPKVVRAGVLRLAYLAIGDVNRYLVSRREYMHGIREMVLQEQAVSAQYPIRSAVYSDYMDR